MAPLSNEDLMRLDDHFVKCADCQERHRETDAQLTNLTVAFTETKTQFKMLMAILGVIGSAVVGILIKMLIGG